jgi:F-type H+-transporting ATPase subunit a
MESPFVLAPLFRLGPVVITLPVVTTWAIMLVLTVSALALTAAAARNRGGALRTVLELIVETLDEQITEAMQVPDAARFRPLVGTLFLFILAANWSSLVPGVEPPTARLETDIALAMIVFVATVYYGVRARGVRGYLGSFAEPTPIMLPLNVLGVLTRTMALFIRLFGSSMSGVFMVAIVLSLAGLLVPIPLMALDLLTGAVQAYIFTVLSMVFIGGAMSETGIRGKRADAEGEEG